MSNKFEQLLDLIVNEETEKAEQLFHEIVVERSRSIYEGLLRDAEQDVEETVGGNAVDSMIDEIETEEEEVTAEAEDDDSMHGDEDNEGNTQAEGDEIDFNGDGEIDAHEEEHGDVEERLDDIEAMLQQFQDELDSALAQIEGGEEEEAGEEGEEEEGGEEEEMPMPTESIVREYKEKVGEAYKSGAAEVKSDGAQSPVAKKGGSMPTAKGVDMAATGSEGQHDFGSKSVKAAKSMNATTEPKLAKVGEAYKSGGAAVGKGDGAESPIEGN